MRPGSVLSGPLSNGWGKMITMEVIKVVARILSITYKGERPLPWVNYVSVWSQWVWLLHNFACMQFNYPHLQAPNLLNTRKKRGGAWYLTSCVWHCRSKGGWQALNISLNPLTVAANRKFHFILRSFQGVNISIFILLCSTHMRGSIILRSHVCLDVTTLVLFKFPLCAKRFTELCLYKRNTMQASAHIFTRVHVNMCTYVSLVYS